MVTSSETMARRCYRLGLGAAKRRDLGAALDYTTLARALDPGHEGAARLAEICRRERGGADDMGKPAVENIEDIENIENIEGFEGLMSLVRQKKWKAAAEKAKGLPRQSVWLLSVQGCLWALAKHYDSAIDCFAGALARDRGNLLAAKALVGLGRQRKSFWRFFCFSLTK
ncbi:MAG: hypothetical protein LBK62_01105 [Treponema sp.]|jgi:hypothetical protein|nr:hypothetical protein [Treponema sp.]